LCGEKKNEKCNWSTDVLAAAMEAVKSKTFGKKHRLAAKSAARNLWTRKIASGIKQGRRRSEEERASPDA
jgi:hypothetical protein